MIARILASSGLALALAACAAEPNLATKAPGGTQDGCVRPGAWYLLDGPAPRAAAASTVLDDAARRDVVLLGEQHDAADHHRWQLHTLAALHALRPDMVIGFEAFPRRVQPVLDRWVVGELDSATFLAEVQWEKVWGFPAPLYLPLFEFARIHAIPMLALNVERDLPRAIGAEGWSGVSAARKEGVSRPAPASLEYRAALFETYRLHPLAKADDGKKPTQDDPAFQRFVESQTTWDRAMAEAIAARLSSAPANRRPLVVGIAGSGHLRQGFGIPHQLRDLGVTRVATLLPLEVPGDCRALGAGFADAVFALPRARAAPPSRPRLGVRLEQKDKTVKIIGIMEGSLAASMDLRAGDVIASIGGAPVTGLESVIAPIRAQPPGTWLPIQLRRGAETLDLVIKFPRTNPKSE